jgi:ABC-type bacteriocin/lantibiotic exporter with double-glycine peptidase domain
MLGTKKIFYILTKKERLGAVNLLMLTLVMALIDMLGIASIMPFIALLTNPEIINTNFFINFAYMKASTLGIKNEQEFLIAVGIFVFLLLIISISIKALTTYFQTRYIKLCEYNLSKRLMERYIYQSYSWFLNRNSSHIGKTILSETSNLIGKGLSPTLSLISNTIIALTLFVMLLFVEPMLTLIVAITVGLFYGFVFILIRKLLNKIAKKNFAANEIKYKVLLEAFNASKEVKVGGLEQIFINRFIKPARYMAYNTALVDIISQFPRFTLEAISFGGLLLVTLFYMITTNDIKDVLPIIALYAFTGYRLMPAIQKIFISLTSLRLVEPTIQFLYKDLNNLNLKIEIKNNKDKLLFKNDIKLKNIFYMYPNSSRTILKNVNLVIPAFSTIGVVGVTGSGKTTVIDIILGLLEPQKGSLEVDGKLINNHNKRAWQNSIGYVPQQIYLADTTISENIAFGKNNDEIDQENVEYSAKIAKLHDFIVDELPLKYQTTVGERGVRLSGGQRQRIGIARAIYNKPKLLVFDEATSALDNKTEKEVMEAIHNTDHKITKILIAHRLSTVKKCDKIFLFDKGELKVEGSYQELINSSREFRANAHNS